MVTRRKRPAKQDIIDMPRFQRKIDKETVPGCWLWTGSYSRKTPNLTFQCNSWSVRGLMAQPDKGQFTIATCGQHSCVNPDHLENVERGRATSYYVKASIDREMGVGPGSAQLRRTHCPEGHPYSEENTYRPPNRLNERRCLACRNIRNAEVHKELRPVEPNALFPSRRDMATLCKTLAASENEVQAARKKLSPVMREIFDMYWGLGWPKPMSFTAIEEETGRDRRYVNSLKKQATDAMVKRISSARKAAETPSNYVYRK